MDKNNLLDNGKQAANGEGEVKNIKFVDNVLKSFCVAKIFRQNTDRINHIDFSSSGDLLISSSDDDQINIYDCEGGVEKRHIFSKKYGVGLIRFTHAKNCVIHSSRKIDDTIRYLSLYDNKYLRYFTGHTKRVTSLSMSPVDDSFISTSEDKDLRIWDLRAPSCQGLMHLTASPLAALDPEGLIFAVGFRGGKIKLYDMRSFDQGPFSSFNFGGVDVENEDWTTLKFSPDGKTIMACNPSTVITLIDSFHGTPMHCFVANHGSKNSRMDASFTPDSKYVLCGSPEGIVHVWTTESGKKLCSLLSDHPGPVDFVKFNPKLMMMATTCSNMAFWLPKVLE